LTAEITSWTTSMFSCDIARPVSRYRVSSKPTAARLMPAIRLLR
jgi:hypothetical protein